MTKLNEFGVRVAAFCAANGMEIQQLAQLAGVKYSTLLDVRKGRTAGHQVIPKVEEAMRQYTAAHTARKNCQSA